MLPVLIFRHVEHEGPGYLQDFLSREKIPFELVCIDAGETVPDSAEKASGLVFMGGDMSVNDPLPWIDAELNLIRKVMKQDLPVLGHCLGGQLIARAMGAVVSQNPVSEVGWHMTSTVSSDASATWLEGLDEELLLFHWHSETFSLPGGAVPILNSRFCNNQGFIRGKILALQCHIEMTESMVQDWAERGRRFLVASDSIQSADEMLTDLRTRISGLNRIAEHFYVHWARGLKR